MAESSKTLDIAADSVEAFDCTACGKNVSVAGMVPFAPIRCPHCNAMQSVPMQLGNFLLLSLLGKGGMGEVYRARDLRLKRYVAIKVMQQALGEDPKFVEDFLREARAAAQFNHPHVAQIYSFGEEKGQACLVMELLEGGSLDKMIASDEPLDEVRVLDIAVDVAQALKAANKIGLRHGDIKPANILFSTSGQAKVVDFGLAWYAESHQQAGEIWGTPYYIAPEKVERKRADQRADMYSFGATFFHALTGEPPFDGESAKDLVVKRLREPAPDIRTLRPDLSPKTAETIARSLQRDPGRRHPTYTSMLADLQAAREEAARLREEAAVAEERNAARARLKSRIQWTLAAAMVLGGAGAGLWVKFRAASSVEAPRPLRHVLIDGRAVPIYSDEEEQQLRERAAPEPTPTSPVAPATVEQALSERQIAALREAIQSAAGGDPIGATIGLHRLHRDTPAGPAAALVRLNMAMSVFMEGEAPIAESHLRAIRQETDAAQPVHALAGILLGEMALADVDAADWPVPEQRLAAFAAGVRQLTDGETSKGMDTLRGFARSTKEEDGWVWAWTPAVQMWSEQLSEWNNIQGRIPNWRPNTSRRRLRDFRRQAPWFLRDDVQQALDGIVDTPPPPAAPRPAAPPPQREDDTAARVQADMDQLDTIVQERRALLAALDFDGARALVQGARPETEEGRKRRQELTEQHRSLTDLKTFVVDRLANDPPPQRIRELRGSIIGADPSGLMLSLREGVTAERKWSEVGPGLFARFADYYVQREPGTPAQQSDRFLALAVFSEALQAADHAATYARLAIDADARAAERARAWLPGIDLSPEQGGPP